MIRPLRPDELATVAGVLDRFGPRFVDAWLDQAQSELWVDERAKPHKLLLVGRALAPALSGMPPGSPEPLVAGLPVAEWDRNGIHLTLEGSFEVGRRTRVGRVVLQEKAVQLFLYGRDVLGESIASSDPDLGPGDLAFATNHQGEVLGIARVLQRLPGRGRSLEAVFDRGWYLREGG